MQTPTSGEEAPTLYDELRDAIHARNRDQAKRVYRELVRAGRPLSEVLGRATTVLATVEKFEPLYDSPLQNLLPQHMQNIQNTLDHTSISPDRVVGSVFVLGGPDTASTPPPDPGVPASSQPRAVLSGQVHSTRHPGQRSNQLGSTSAPQGRARAAAIIDSPAVPSSTEIKRNSHRRPRGHLTKPPFRITYVVALVAVVAMASVGLFFRQHPAEYKVAFTIPPDSVVIASEGLSSTGAILAGEIEATGVASFTSTGASAASSGAPITGVAQIVPNGSVVRSEHSNIDFDLSNYSVPSVSADSDRLAPAGEPPETAHSVPAALVLLEHGDSLFRVGDVASARLFYQRAADADDGHAALRLGATYDPDFLAHFQLGALHGDIVAATYWYRRASELGSTDAETLLHAIEMKNER